MKTIIFGDVDQSLCDFATEFNATLADISNLKIAINDDRNYFTSIGDLSIEMAQTLVNTSQRVIIQPKKIWSDHNLMKTTVYLCRYLDHTTPVENINFYSWLNFSYQSVIPDTPNPSLYLFGGSIVSGVGLDDSSQRAGELISKKRKLQLIDHSNPGTGMRRSFEQLMSCNPKPGDMVLLDTGEPVRLRFAKNHKVVDLSLHMCSKEIVLATDEDQLFYNQISYVDAFVKHCKTSNLKLVFYSRQMFSPDFSDYMLHYSRHAEWCLNSSRVITRSIDLGNDSLHPGSLTHQELARLLDMHFTRLYETSNIR